MLPYSRRLLALRAAGERPWLVVVTMGNDADRKLMRMGAFDGDAGAARIWVPDDFNVADADLSWVVGLDVFVAPFCDFERSGAFLVQLWKARPATLWTLDGKTELNRSGQWHTNMSKFTGTQARLFPPFRTAFDFSATHRHELPLDKTFKRQVAAARELALLVGDEPLFNDPRFEEARSKLLAA
jgi:hypothetical protein